MLHFFRQLHRKLILSDKIRKYLLYAFGEILLVAIGILIVPQVNNWNKQLKLEKEGKALIAIITE